MTARQYISPKEAAALLGVHPQTIRRFIREGALTRHYLGRLVRLDRLEVLSLIRRDEPEGGNNGGDTPAGDPLASFDMVGGRQESLLAHAAG